MYRSHHTYRSSTERHIRRYYLYNLLRRVCCGTAFYKTRILSDSIDRSIRYILPWFTAKNVEVIALKNDFINFIDFTGSGLTFISGFNLINSINTIYKYYSNSGGKKEIIIKRTEDAGIFKIIRTNGPAKTTDEIINYYLKRFEKEVETGSNNYRGNYHGNLYGRVRLPRSFLFLLYYIILLSFY